MPIYEVNYYYSDTCGNTDSYHYGFFEAENDKQIRKIFPVGFLCGWNVYRIIAKPLPTKPVKVPREP
jgi:hypothetical protein